MNFYDYFLNKINVNKLLVDEKISIGKSSDGFNQMLIALDFYKGNKSIFVVLPNIYMAQTYYDTEQKLKNYLATDQLKQERLCMAVLSLNKKHKSF